LIVAGDITPKTKEALLKQLNEPTTLVVAAMSPETVKTDNGAPGDMMDAQASFNQRPQRQPSARGGANITDPITKVVGLILGSPEFQRQ
jgi:hypothetical protein